MTTPLATAIAVLAFYGVYMAAMVARAGRAPGTFLHGGNDIPGWSFAFTAAGVVLAGFGLTDHLGLVDRYGLQASHVGVGIIIASLAVILVLKRLWLGVRITGLASVGLAIGWYYQSTTVRLFIAGLAALFALPFSAHVLSGAGAIIDTATDGAIPRQAAIWTLTLTIFLPAVIGGWRAVVLVAGMQSAMVVVAIVTVVLFGEGMFADGGFLRTSIPVADSILAEHIPGVVQYAAGIGKAVPAGGIFTTVGVASATLALVGFVLSPAFLYLGMTTRPGHAFAVMHVWLMAGLVGAVLVLAVPFLATRIDGDLVAFATMLARVDVLAGATAVFGLVVATQLTVAFFVTGGTLQIARDLLFRDVLPELHPRAERFATRIALAGAFISVALLAAFSPLTSANLASVALPLSVQVAPALLGFAFVPWISRAAVLAGMILGGLVVIFTEPPGLVLFEGLFVDLPWGRWPLTVHSAAWGLMCNVVAVLLVSIFTRRGTERDVRDRLHDEFRASWPVRFGGPASRTAAWSLVLLWSFFALGPGAILGNTFFIEPVFADEAAALGLPSLWVWQILFWMIGVPLVWWLAYPARLGTTTQGGLRTLVLNEDQPAFPGEKAPGWIASGLSRLRER